MGDDRRTRRELVAEIDALHKRLARLEAGTGTTAEDLEGSDEHPGETRLRRLLARATDLICEVDRAGRLLFVSPNAREILGRSVDDLLGRSLLEDTIANGVHPDDRETLVRAVRGEDRDAEFICRFRVGEEWRWFATRSRAAHDEDGEWRAVIVSRDVTEREEALRQLRLSETRHRVLIESTHDLVAELDAEGRVLFVSPSCLEVLGYRPEEMIGTTPFALLHPEDVESLAQRFLDRLETRRRQGGGAVFRIRHRDGSWRWLQGGGVNFFGADGEPHIVAVTRDVTLRIQGEEERKRLEERVQEAEKFESLGMLAAGMARNFNSLLTPILGAASLALLDAPDGSPLRKPLEDVQRASRRAAQLTGELLEYAGMGSLDPEWVDLTEALAADEARLRGALTRRASLALELDPDVPPVEVDRAQLSQLATNLMTNAGDAIDAAQRGPGRVVLRTGSARLDAAAIASLSLDSRVRPGHFTWLEIEDDGCGMDPATRARVLDPFFSTKPGARGLGLAVVLGIVRTHRGVLEIESRAGAGTRVRIWLPAARGLPPPR